MSHEPRITTILPTYRRPTLLKRAVLSAVSQSYSQFVVKILDNASGDGTEDVAHELMRMDSRIQYYKHPENIGSLNNMIYGMDRVTTPYFNILCDDDLLMPEFFATAMRLFDEGDGTSAFVSTKVVVLDETGMLSTPFDHPQERCRLSPPFGMERCIKAGVSLPGVMYRSNAMQEVGAPRTAWWNWTESGWHALAAVKAPVEFSPEIGAIMFNHLAGGSKRMDGMEFRISWLRMLAEVREAAAAAGVSDAEWRRQMHTHQSRTFASCCLRLSRDGDRNADAEVRTFGVRSGLNASLVAGAVGLSKAVRGIGAGGMLNGAIDRLLKNRTAWRAADGMTRSKADHSLAAASDVLRSLNGLAGVTPNRAI